MTAWANAEAFSKNAVCFLWSFLKTGGFVWKVLLSGGHPVSVSGDVLRSLVCLNVIVRPWSLTVHGCGFTTGGTL